MGNGSPTAFLLWAILSCIFLVFLIVHLWNYDRFNCLRWDAGRQPGAFRRVMTYSYLASVPLIVVFSVAITAIKFKEGFIMNRDGHIMPRPFSMWDNVNRRWVLPLYFVLSLVWSLEIVTHLEELTFWVFLLNQGPRKRDWFASWEFRVWKIGSIAAIMGMPMIAIFARHNLDTCLSYVFLVGSLAGTFTNICFLYVLGRFPWFIRHVKLEGAEPDVVIRLTTFYQLNCIRVIFRFLFTVPLLIMALDGIRGPYPIIGDPFASDFLLMMGGIGCSVSSAITLLIFFPRSITRESGYQAKPTSPHSSKLHPPSSPLPNYSDGRHFPSPKPTLARQPEPETHINSFHVPNTLLTHSLDFRHSTQSLPSHHRNSHESELSPTYESDAESIRIPSPQFAPIRCPPLPVRPAPVSFLVPSPDDTDWERAQEVAIRTRRRHSDGPFFFDRRQVAWSSLVQGGRDAHSSYLHPYVISFTSPIDLMDVGHGEINHTHEPLS